MTTTTAGGARPATGRRAGTAPSTPEPAFGSPLVTLLLGALGGLVALLALALS